MLPRRLVLPLFLFCVAFLARPSAATPFQWDFTGNLETFLVSQTATLLPNGKVLVAGGGIPGEPFVTDTAELYDPAAGTWAYTGSLTLGRTYHTATLLSDGKVLVVAGLDAQINRITSAEVYSPGTGTWRVTGSLAVGRSSHSAVLLHDGRVLVAAGVDGGAVAELYDPATGTWSQTGSLSIARNYGQTMTVLADGKVLIVGGLAGTELATAELWDPATGLWTPTGSLTTGGRQYHTATLLPDGKVLVAGGYNPTLVFGALASAELYDPALGTWRATGSLNIGHRRHTATLLPNGTVLVASGQFLSEITTAEIYDPATETWTVTGSLHTPRIADSATLLSDGNVLVAGGYNIDNADINTAELYDSGLTPATQVNGRGAIDGQGDRASFTLHVTQSANRPSGSLSFSDPAANTSIAKAKIRTLTFNGESAALGGTARLGDGTNATFSVSVSDNSSDGSSDTFSISLSNGYSAGGTLTSGDIQIQ